MSHIASEHSCHFLCRTRLGLATWEWEERVQAPGGVHKVLPPTDCLPIELWLVRTFCWSIEKAVELIGEGKLPRLPG